MLIQNKKKKTNLIIEFNQSSSPASLTAFSKPFLTLPFLIPFFTPFPKASEPVNLHNVNMGLINVVGDLKYI